MSVSKTSYDWNVLVCALYIGRYIATFMYKFHNELLPIAFHSFFTTVTNIHNYNTAKQSYYLPLVRTNYGKFVHITAWI